MTVIKDGTGSGRLVEVDTNNRLVTDSVSQSVEHFHNHVKGTAYQITIQETPTGANDYFFHLKNTGIKDLIIEGMAYRTAINERIVVYLSTTGTTSGGTAILPYNVNAGSSSELSGTVEGGSDITGLSNGRLAERIWVATSNSSTFHNFEMDIVITPQKTFSLLAEVGGGQIDAVIYCYETVA